MIVDHIDKHARYIMNYSRFNSLIALLPIVATSLGALAADRPNIIWIIVEDMSCDFGYQGQTLVNTPNVDRLAKEGVAFSNAYVSSPVCSPSRSALITGMYQTSIGCQHHYTGRGTIKHHLPAHVMLIPELFKEAGYYTCNTVIFFITDHGISQARGKQFLYDEGAKIPFVVWAPGRIESGAAREESISHIDMAATSLHFAGIDVPEYMQARPLFGPQAQPREYVVCARDRCDETVDRIRSVRKGKYEYIRHFYPKRPYLQPCVYNDHKPFMKRLRYLHAADKLDDVQSLFLAQSRPEEELYDLSKDRWEIHNLAKQPEHLDKLREMRAILTNWIIESDDQGRFPESEAMYDSAMKKYIDGMTRRGDTERAQDLQANINLMKQWDAEGK